MSSNSTCIRELESKLASKNSELEAAKVELGSTERLPRFGEDAINLMQEKVQKQGPQLREVELAYVAAETLQAAAESNVHLLTASKSGLNGKVVQLTGLETSVETKSRECVKRATVRWRTFFSNVMAYKCVSILRLHSS